MFILAFEEPWDSHGWRADFLGVYASVEDAERNKDADAIVIVESGGLRLVRQRGRDERWVERDERITGRDE